MAQATPAHGRVMGGLARAVVEVAAQDGCDLSDVLARFEVEPAALDRADQYVSVQLHEALWAEGARRTGRDDFGVYAAQRFNPGLTGVVEYILRNCATVRDGVASWLRLAPLVSDCISSVLLREGDMMHLYWRLARPLSEGTRHWAEFALGRALQLVREGMSLADAAPAQVWFRHPAPADTQRHRALFGAPLRFDRPEHALVWPSAWLEQPLKGIDPGMRAALEQRAEQLRTQVTARGTLAEASREAMRALLYEPVADARLERVAERLSLAPRTLQRKLRAEGTSFQRLLDEVRQTEAERLLRTTPLRTVAARLGFSDAAALRKARQRWRRQGDGTNF